MIWLRCFAVLGLVVGPGVLWLLFFNFLVIVTHANLGFCENVSELMKPNPDCPAPLWYWFGNLTVPLILIFGGIRKIRLILREHKNDRTE